MITIINENAYFEDGKTFQAKEVSLAGLSYSCYGCVNSKVKCSDKGLPPCSWVVRSDQKNIIWVEVGELIVNKVLFLISGDTSVGIPDGCWALDVDELYLEDMKEYNALLEFIETTRRWIANLFTTKVTYEIILKEIE